MCRVLVVTSGRADKTPLRPVINALRRHDYVSSWSLEGKPVGECVGEMMCWLRCVEPECVLLLGDRFETLSAALAATYEGIPIAHIHGGEASYGSFDNQIRDAITKLAHIHFVAAEPMKQRLLDLGEEEHRIHVVGAPGLDNLTDLPHRRPQKYFVATYHPETLGHTDVLPLLEATEDFAEYDVFWTTPNNDPMARDIRQRIEQTCSFADWSPPQKYIHACRDAALVIGNSSSGIIEMPTLEVPTVNVGSRQDGRLKGPSIFDCTNDRHEIVKSIRQALEYDGPFTNPYGGPGASEKIAAILSSVEIDMVKKWST